MVNNKEDVIRISKEILNPETKNERYTLYLASEYMKNNISEFADEEIFDIFNNYSFFKNNMTNDLSKRMLDCAISKNKSFVKLMPIWFTNNYDRKKMNEYLKIINNENNGEQLRVFAKNNYSRVEVFFKREAEKQSEELIDIVLSKNYENLVYLHEFNKKKLLEIAENEEVYLIYLANTAHVNKNKELEYNTYDLIVKDWEKSKVNIDKKLDDINKLQVEFLIYLNKYNKDIFNSIFSKRINYSYKCNEKTKNINCNMAQLILYKKLYKINIKEIENIFSENKGLILENIIEEINYYSIKKNFIQFCMENDHIKALTLFNLNDKELNEDEREMILSVSIYHLAHKHKDYHQEYQGFIEWAKSIFVDAELDMINKYMKKINIKISPEGKDFFNKVIVSKKLDKELPIKTSKLNLQKI